MKYPEFNEKKQHGSPDFPIQYYHVTPYHPQYEMPLHWHREFEIIRVISGRFTLFADNVEYDMSAGDIGIVECGILHRGTPENCVYECLVFDIGMLRKKHNDVLSNYLLPILNREVDVKTFHPSGQGEFYKITAELFETMRASSEFYELKVQGLIYTFFACLYSCGFVTKSAKHRHADKQVKTLMELLDWIDTRYNDSITLKDLAKVSGMNEKYLCRFFKEYTSKTPIDYINSLRIECACHELTVTGATITEAAIESGFNDLSYFSKTFKKYKGISPREFLKSKEK